MCQVYNGLGKNSSVLTLTSVFLLPGGKFLDLGEGNKKRPNSLIIKFTIYFEFSFKQQIRPSAKQHYRFVTSCTILNSLGMGRGFFLLYWDFFFRETYDCGHLIFSSPGKRLIPKTTIYLHVFSLM